MQEGIIHLDFSPAKNCENPYDSYGVICVKCNKCGRFDKKCINCETRTKKVSMDRIVKWKLIQLYDGWFWVCPKCQKLFSEKEITEVVPCKEKDFKKRR